MIERGQLVDCALPRFGGENAFVIIKGAPAAMGHWARQFIHAGTEVFLAELAGDLAAGAAEKPWKVHPFLL